MIENIKLRATPQLCRCDQCQQIVSLQDVKALSGGELFCSDQCRSEHLEDAVAGYLETFNDFFEERR